MVCELVGEEVGRGSGLVELSSFWERIKIKITKITLIISFRKDKDDKNCDGEEHEVNNSQPM